MPDSAAVMLPSNVTPVRYALTLTPDLSGFTFDGSETVEIEVLEPTSTIILNCVEIAIRSCAAACADGRTLESRPAEYNEADETAILQFESALPPGKATLDIRFAGELNDKLRGFYRSRYIDTQGGERYLATTQFEATDARRAFPCWDEPSLKANFSVTLEVPQDLAAVSNMPIVDESPTGNGTRIVRFAETPPMSTYLLAFVVGDISSVEAQAADGTLIRVWATSGNEQKGRFALDTAVQLLSYFNEYFGIAYPLEKLDHVAIPDFAAGAMENWGAITYRESALLVDPEHSSAGTRQIVASIVAHEMAHMWFGDLVTMSWWNDLWLNESFASWMGDKSVDHLHPEWEVWTRFLVEDTNRGLSLDGLKNSHPIEQEVNNPAEIGQLFDAISYSKGASILRMLEQFLGEDTFRDGLRRYLRDHEYGNARTRDLWDALGSASGQPVAEMMDTWVQQTGYPVVDVSTTHAEDSVEVTAYQRRFLYEHISDSDAQDDTRWHVPIAVRGPDPDRRSSTLMKTAEASLRLPDEGEEPPWIKVNPEQTGFYRVNYTAEGWERLRGPISNLELPPSDRLGIQNDAYALSRAGMLAATHFLRLAEAYAAETDASVWADLAANLSGVDMLLAGEPFHARFQALARSVFQTIGRTVGWDAGPNEGHPEALRRSTVLDQLGRYEDGPTLAEAERRFERYVEDPSTIDPDIRRVVFALAAQGGETSAYDTMWELALEIPLQEEKMRLLAGLTQFPQAELLARTLSRSLSEDVRNHETIPVISGVASNRHGRDLAWEFVKENWDELDRRYGEGGFGLMYLVSLTGGFTTLEQMDDVERFFHDHPAPAAERTIRQSLERIRLNIAWLKLNRSDLEGWLYG